MKLHGLKMLDMIDQIGLRKRMFQKPAENQGRDPMRGKIKS